MPEPRRTHRTEGALPEGSDTVRAHLGHHDPNTCCTLDLHQRLNVLDGLRQDTPHSSTGGGQHRRDANRQHAVAYGKNTSVRGGVSEPREWANDDRRPKSLRGKLPEKMSVHGFARCGVFPEHTAA